VRWIGFQFLTVHETTFTQPHQALDELHRIEIVDILCPGMVAHGLMVAGEGQDVHDAESGRAQHVGWMARRFRSRVTIWMTGSISICLSMIPVAMRTCALPPSGCPLY
jgi:hypothetical protein